VAAAALEQGILPKTTFTCSGLLDVGGRIFHCNQSHGELDMSGGLAQSCNIYFIQLAQHIDKQLLLDLVKQFGFGENISLAPGLASAAGNLPTFDAFRLPGALANFAFGQGELLCSPLQMAAATACLVNDGLYQSPTLISALVDDQGKATPQTNETQARQVVSSSTARQVREMMVGVVEGGSGKFAKPAGSTAGGKTATAQSGIFTAEGKEVLQTGFTGYFPADDPQYVVTILKQNGVSGSADCAPVFRQIAEAVLGAGKESTTR
jgi:penicillin-binding protein 2